MKLDIQDLKVLLNWTKHTAVAQLESVISPANRIFPITLPIYPKSDNQC